MQVVTTDGPCLWPSPGSIVKTLSIMIPCSIMGSYDPFRLPKLQIHVSKLTA